MRKLVLRQKIDVGLFFSLIVICISLLLVIRSNSKIVEIDLSNSQLLCKENKGKYRGYFVQNNQKYYLGQKYGSCDAFKARMEKKELHGKYLTANNAIIELRVDGEFVKKASTTKQVYMGIFVAFIVFCIIRKPIQWIVSKYV